MRGRQDHADHAPRRVLDQAQARRVGTGIGAHGFRAQDKADIAQLDGFVIGAADFGLGQFDAPRSFSAASASGLTAAIRALASNGLVSVPSASTRARRLHPASP
jgi:hypothetical protein